MANTYEHLDIYPVCYENEQLEKVRRVMIVGYDDLACLEQPLPGAGQWRQRETRFPSLHLDGSSTESDKIRRGRARENGYLRRCSPGYAGLLFLRAPYNETTSEEKKHRIQGNSHVQVLDLGLCYVLPLNGTKGTSRSPVHLWLVLSTDRS
jgi:hypothetical protein